MHSHGRLEDSSGKVTKGGFLNKVLFELNLKTRRSQPSEALEEDCSR